MYDSHAHAYSKSVKLSMGYHVAYQKVCFSKQQANFGCVNHHSSTGVALSFLFSTISVCFTSVKLNMHTSMFGHNIAWATMRRSNNDFPYLLKRTIHSTFVPSTNGAMLCHVSAHTILRLFTCLCFKMFLNLELSPGHVNQIPSMFCT